MSVSAALKDVVEEMRKWKTGIENLNHIRSPLDGEQIVSKANQFIRELNLIVIMAGAEEREKKLAAEMEDSDDTKALSVLLRPRKREELEKYKMELDKKAREEEGGGSGIMSVMCADGPLEGIVQHAIPVGMPVGASTLLENLFVYQMKEDKQLHFVKAIKGGDV